MRLRLYQYWDSSSSYRVRFALNVKGVPYETMPIDLTQGEQHAPGFRALSPLGSVPCLLIDGEPFVESVAILELLEELFPAPRLFPEGARDRARVRALVELINSETQPLQNRRVRTHHSSSPDAQRAWAQHFIQLGLEAFERMMAAHEERGLRGRYAFGDTLTAADVFLVPQVYSAESFGVDLSPFPRVRAAAATAADTAAAHAAHPARQPDTPMEQRR